VNKAGIYTGCPVVYKPRANDLNHGRVSGTFVDNRGACAALVKIAESLKNNRPDGDVFLVGTVQEEFNLRGAMMAARTVRPDIAISLDVTLAGDTVDLDGYFDAKLGAGPCVQLYTFHSRGTLNGNLPHGPLFNLIKKTAEENKFPLQRTTGFGMLTDASYIQFENMGVAVMDMGFATRYTHTPVELCDTKDVEQLAMLVSEITRQVDEGFELNRLK
jgi:putative aminopeptidase FrvX